jgi:hypothetical protein
MAEIEEEIVSMTQLWIRAVSSENPREVVKLYSDSAVLVPTLSNKIRTTSRDIFEYFEYFLKKQPEIEVCESFVNELNNIAIHSGKYIVKINSNTRETVSCRFTFVYERDVLCKWKILHHHSSICPEST